MFCITIDAYPMRHYAGFDAERSHPTRKQSRRTVCDDLGQGIMIRLQPRASDGVAGPRLQS